MAQETNNAQRKPEMKQENSIPADACKAMEQEEEGGQHKSAF